MPFNVQPASQEDQERVAALWQECNLVASYNDPRADFQFALAGESSHILIGLSDDGALAGSVMVGHDGHRGWVYYVSVAERYRSRGAGRVMIEAAEEWLRQRGVRKVQLLVRETNRGVVSFYEKLGFEIAPVVVMSRWLTQK